MKSASQSLPMTARARSAHGIGPDSPEFLDIGRMKAFQPPDPDVALRQKDHELLIEAEHLPS